MYIRKDLALQIIMHCHTVEAIEFKRGLGFNQLDLVMSKEKSVSAKIMNTFSSKKNNATPLCLGRVFN